MTYSSPKIFICIPIFNRISFTINCLLSINRSSYKNFQVIICDDGSTDNSSIIIKQKFPSVIIVKGDGNLFWTGATAMAIEKALELCAKSDLIFTLNNDTELLIDTLEVLLESYHNNSNSIIGALNVFYDNPKKIEPSGFIKKGGLLFPEFQNSVHQYGQFIQNEKEMIEVDSLSGKGVLVPVHVFEKTGNYNYKMIPHYFGDTEFTIRAQRKGYKIYLNTKAKVLSHVDETGPGTIKNKTTCIKYLNSFLDIRSENYIPSIKNRAKLVYTNHWRVYFVFNVVLRFLKNIKTIKL